MWVYRGLDEYPPDSPETIVALGAFDGIHRGHQEVLRTAVQRGRATGLPAVAVTFEPHPMQILNPEHAPSPIVSLEERVELIGAQGADGLLIIPFTLEFSRVEAEEFVAKVLRDRLRAKEVVVGFNHTFGRGARGTARFLEEVAHGYGFAVHVVPPTSVGGMVVSSTAIREALGRGDVQIANLLLGRPYGIRGEVLLGKSRGRSLGFPTANLRPPSRFLLASGVYAGQATWADGNGGAVINVGYRPTFGGGDQWVEAHLLDFSGDLYGKTLSLLFLHRIRAEQKFESVRALRAQIARDVERAREILSRVEDLRGLLA